MGLDKLLSPSSNIRGSTTTSTATSQYTVQYVCRARLPGCMSAGLDCPLCDPLQPPSPPLPLHPLNLPALPPPSASSPRVCASTCPRFQTTALPLRTTLASKCRRALQGSCRTGFSAPWTKKNPLKHSCLGSDDTAPEAVRVWEPSRVSVIWLPVHSVRA